MMPSIKKHFCVKPFPGAKRNFVPKGIPIGFEMAEKTMNKQTDKHFRIYISKE